MHLVTDKVISRPQGLNSTCSAWTLRRRHSEKSAPGRPDGSSQMCNWLI